MKKYKVYGTVTVCVTKEVWANSEDEAREKAYDQLSCLTAYCGNGGGDKLVGVDGDDESVDTFDDIEYTDAEEIEDDPDYFECPDCGEECNIGTDDNGDKYWYCDVCHSTYDEDGDEFEPYFEDEEGE